MLGGVCASISAITCVRTVYGPGEPEGLTPAVVTPGWSLPVCPSISMTNSLPSRKNTHRYKHSHTNANTLKCYHAYEHLFLKTFYLDSQPLLGNAWRAIKFLGWMFGPSHFHSEAFLNFFKNQSITGVSFVQLNEWLLWPYKKRTGSMLPWIRVLKNNCHPNSVDGERIKSRDLTLRALS